VGNVLLNIILLLLFRTGGENSLVIKGTESAISLTYSGFSKSLLFTLRSEKNVFYLGPRLSLTQQNLTGKEISGFNAGIRHHFSENGLITSFFTLDYQSTYFRPYNWKSDRLRWNNLHELNFGYGISIRILRKFLLSNSIGLGRYLEVFHLPQSTMYYKGYCGLIKAHLLYEF
jgi:hypothetical protein